MSEKIIIILISSGVQFEHMYDTIVVIDPSNQNKYWKGSPKHHTTKIKNQKGFLISAREKLQWPVAINQFLFLGTAFVLYEPKKKNRFETREKSNQTENHEFLSIFVQIKHALSDMMMKIVFSITFTCLVHDLPSD